MTRWHVLLVCLLIALFTTAAVAETPAGKVMIVLDASGSMWGQIDGKAKIDIARQVIKDLLKDWDPKRELGLAAYGHRRKGDCADIEVLVEVGPNRVQEVLAAIDGLVPKGKTPLSDAVRLAAESLKYVEETAAVILVSDGRETCNADPCALGTELEQNGLNFTAHVIGFDIAADEEAGLRCLAENTGGRYLTAKDSDTLKTALQETVAEVIKTEPPAPAPAKEPEPPKAASEQVLKLIAVYKQGGKEYSDNINWKVIDSGKETIAEQYRGKSGHVFEEIPPGTYTVVAELSDAKHIRREFTIDVEPGESAHELSLDIGTVRLDARFAEGGEAFEGDLGWKLDYPKADLSGNRKELVNFWRRKSGDVFLLPSGEWLLSGILADAKHVPAVQKKIVVEPGGEELLDFVLNAGLVRFDALLSEGGEAFKGDLGWRLLSPKADLSGAHKEVANFWRKKSGEIFILPAGDWLVEGTFADHKSVKITAPISLAPGGEEPFTFVFNAGAMRVDVTLEGEAWPGEVGWEVLSAKEDLAGNRKKITDAWRVRSGAVVYIPAGDYLLRTLNPDQKEMKGETTFSIAAGEEKAVSVDMKNP